MPVSYIGGKSKIGKWITPHYSKDIKTYSECFGGMFWCFFNMNINEFTKLSTVIYNDFNPLNANFFRCLRNPELLLIEIEKIPCQEKDVASTPPEYKELFGTFQKKLFDAEFKVGIEPDYEVAAQYAYILTQVFSGSKPEKSSYIDLKGKYKSKYLTFRDKLKNPNWVEKFKKIQVVENMDFEEFIKKYDNEDYYVYVDAPYYKTEDYYSNHDFGLKDHERLANTLKNMKGKFSMSYYYFPQLEEWFPKDQYRWESKSFAKAAGAKKGEKQSMGEELLIMNY
jgi:DNA adenine methylase